MMKRWKRWIGFASQNLSCLRETKQGFLKMTPENKDFSMFFLAHALPPLDCPIVSCSCLSRKVCHFESDFLLLFGIPCQGSSVLCSCPLCLTRGGWVCFQGSISQICFCFLHVCFDIVSQWHSHWRVQGGAECHPWQRKICQNWGKRGKKSRKIGKEKVKSRRFFHFAPPDR